MLTDAHICGFHYQCWAVAARWRHAQLSSLSRLTGGVFGHRTLAFLPPTVFNHCRLFKHCFKLLCSFVNQSYIYIVALLCFLMILSLQFVTQLQKQHASYAKNGFVQITIHFCFHWTWNTANHALMSRYRPILRLICSTEEIFLNFPDVRLDISHFYLKDGSGLVWGLVGRCGAVVARPWDRPAPVADVTTAILRGQECVA